MPIPVQCAQCSAAFRVKDEFAGRRGKCPKCSSAIDIPAVQFVATAAAATAVRGAPPPLPDDGAPRAKAASLELDLADVPRPAVPATSRTISPEQILSAFTGKVEPVKLGGGYKLGVALVSVVMAILPFIYLAIIVAVAWAVKYHLVNHIGILTGARGRSGILVALLLYVTPAAAGGVLVLFMVKPLFAKNFVADKPRSLKRENEPLLFAFVDRICQVVGAPRPKRIDIDCQVNASASFRRGIWSMAGNDLVLTIGLPLVAGLSMQQFAGVLAHEFGHFAQGTGMRVTYLLRSISFWFTRVVYQRDEWDEWLVASTRDNDVRLKVVFGAIMGCVWVTRRILWLLMHCGNAVSGFLLRQMEFDADRYEARLAGSTTFGKTARDLRILNVATQGAFADLDHFYRDGRLSDNLPRLIAFNVRHVTEEIQQVIDKDIAESKTGWFDSHPNDRARVVSAAAEQAAGVFHCDAPATELFTDFNAVSRTATFDYYRGIFGEQFRLTDMHPVESLVERQNEEVESGKALDRYAQGTFSSLRKPQLPGGWANAAADPKASFAQIKSLRQQLVAAAPPVRATIEEYLKADSQVCEQAQASALLRAKLKVKPETFSQPLASLDRVRHARETSQAQMAKLGASLQHVEQMFGQRMFAAIELLHHPQVAPKIPSADALQRSAIELLPVAVQLGQRLDDLLRIRDEHAGLGTLLENIDGNEQNESLIDQIRREMSVVWNRLKELRESLQHARHPLDHAKGDITLAQYMFESMPDSEDLGGIMNACGATLDRLPMLYYRVMARLAHLAEKVEAALGLPPLPESVRPAAKSQEQPK